MHENGLLVIGCTHLAQQTGPAPPLLGVPVGHLHRPLDARGQPLPLWCELLAVPSPRAADVHEHGVGRLLDLLTRAEGERRVNNMPVLATNHDRSIQSLAVRTSWRQFLDVRATTLEEYGLLGVAARSRAAPTRRKRVAVLREGGSIVPRCFFDFDCGRWRCRLGLPIFETKYNICIFNFCRIDVCNLATKTNFRARNRSNRLVKMDLFLAILGQDMRYSLA